MKKLWAEHYRPSTLDGFVFTDQNQENLIRKFIEEKTIPHLLLTGHRGTGKTTLARILKTQLGVDDADWFYSNASAENSIDDVRQKILPFISTCAYGDYKIVFLDEADYISPTAQGALRAMTEEYSHNARFILACNYPHKIIPEIKSRFQEIKFKALNKNSILEKCAIILSKEKVKCTLDVLEAYVDQAYPDMRQILILLQNNVKDNVLQSPHDTDKHLEIKLQIIDNMESGDWESARHIAAASFNDAEWIDLYRFLYEHLHEIQRFKDKDKWKAGIVAIADHLYKHSFVADPEINAVALFIRLEMI